MVTNLINRLKAFINNIFGEKKTIKLGIYGEPNSGKTTLANKIAMDFLGETVGEVSEMPHTTRMIQKVEHIEINSNGKKLIMNLLDMPGLATQIDYKEFMRFYKSAASTSLALNDFTVASLKKIAKERGLSDKGTKKVLVTRLSKTVDESELPELKDRLNLKVLKSKKKKKHSKIESQKIAEEATKGVIEAIKWLDNVDSVLLMMDATKDPLTQVNIMLLGNLEAKGIPVIIIANKNDLEKADPTRIENAFPQHTVVPVSASTGNNLEMLYETIAAQEI